MIGLFQLFLLQQHLYHLNTKRWTYSNNYWWLYIFFLNFNHFSITTAKSTKIYKFWLSWKKKPCDTVHKLLYTYMIICKHLPSPRSIIITELDEIKPGICKVQSPIGVVQCQPIWPVQVLRNDHFSPNTIHSWPLNLWVLSPVSPEKISCSGNVNILWKHKKPK